MNAVAKSNRLDELDVASGIVALLVVVGHLVEFNGFVFRWIFSFHMPFFFMKSGWCTSDRMAERPLGSTLLRKIRTLLLPSLIMNVLSILLGMAATPTLNDALYYIFVAPGKEWFYCALFIVQVAFIFFARIIDRVKNESLQRVIVMSVSAMLPCFAAVVVEKGFHNHQYIPFQTGSVLIGMMFFLVAHYVRRWTNFADFVNRVRTGGGVIWAALSLAAIILVGTYYNTYVNISNGYFGRSDLFFLLTSVFWTMVFVWIAHGLCDVAKQHSVISFVKGQLRIIGLHSGLFYLGHGILFYIFNQYLYRKTGILYTPMVDLPADYAVVYFLVSCLSLTILANMIEWIKKLIKNKQMNS